MIPEIINDRQKWLKDRNTYIGGSELTAIQGIDEYSSKYDIWLIKTGREQPFDDNKHTLAGRFLEDGIAKYFEHESGHRLINVSQNNEVYSHPEYAFLKGSPDRRIFWNDNGKFSERAVLEVKTTMKIIDYDDIPFSWFIQPNWYTGLLKYKRFIIVWFEFFTKELKWREFEFSQDIFDTCTKDAYIFWNEHIIKDIPPEPTTTSDILKMFPEHEEGKSIIADDFVLDIYSKAIDVKREVGKLNKDYKSLTEKIRVVMKDAEVLYSPEMIKLFTFRSGAKGRVLRIKEI